MSAKRKKLTKKQRERRNKRLVSFFFVLMIFVAGYFIGKNGINREKWKDTYTRWEAKIEQYFKANDPASAPAPATIRFLDVGQGSATLLQGDDGTTILIDSGRYNDGDKRILQYLDRYVGTGGEIDLLIFTHNDADHIGYGDRILSYYNVKEVWMNGVDTTTKIYEQVLDAIADSNATYVEPKAGDVRQEGLFTIRVINPVEGATKDQNNNSIAAKIEVNQFAVMITGDADSQVESKLMENTFALETDALLLGHHGSKYSTSKKWLQFTKPEFAVYSAGEENAYNHPDDEVKQRVINEDILLYGTDVHGTISVFIKEDGSYTIETEKGGEENEDGS